MHDQIFHAFAPAGVRSSFAHNDSKKKTIRKSNAKFSFTIENQVAASQKFGAYGMANEPEPSSCPAKFIFVSFIYSQSRSLQPSFVENLLSLLCDITKRYGDLENWKIHSLHTFNHNFENVFYLQIRTVIVSCAKR